MCMNMRMCMNMHIRQCEETWTYWLDMRVKMRISDEYALFLGNMRGNRGMNIHEYTCLVYMLHIQCTDIGESCVPHITTLLCGVSCCALLHMFVYTFLGGIRRLRARHTVIHKTCTKTFQVYGTAL